MFPSSLRADWLVQAQKNSLAGLTTAFALVPECIAFALVAHLNPLMGLYGAFIICTMTAMFGGRPGMISGAAGSMAVVIVALVVQHGVDYLLATVILAGIFMALFGLLRLGKLIRMVPHPVMLGFVNGLAIVIAMAQLAQFRSGGQWLQGSALAVMVGLVAVTMAIVYLLPRITKAVPPALVAIVGVGLASYFLHLPTRTLGDLAQIAGGLPEWHWPSVPLNAETLHIVLPYAALIALVGLRETLLTFNLTDELTQTRGAPNRECVALGAANIVSGLFGGMGGCAMIGQTMINLSSGGRSRLAALLTQHKPAVVVIELGGNDALRGLPLKNTEENLTAMTDAAQKAGAKVLLVGMQVPPNYGTDYANRFAGLFTTVAQAKKVAVVPFFLKGVADGPDPTRLFQADRIHPRAEAHPQMLANVWPELKKLLR